MRRELPPLPPDLKAIFDIPEPRGSIDNSWFEELEKHDISHDDIDIWIKEIEAKSRGKK